MPWSLWGARKHHARRGSGMKPRARDECASPPTAVRPLDRGRCLDLCDRVAQQDFSQMLLRDMGGKLTDSQRTYSSQIQAAGEKCQAMLDQLTLFSRVQTCQLNCASHDAG